MHTEEIMVPMMVNGRKMRRPIKAVYDTGRIYLYFRFNREFMADVKIMERAKWHGYDEPNPRKVWSVADSPRNRFQLRLWQYEAMDQADREKNPKLNPYYNFDRALIKPIFHRDALLDHQKNLVSTILTRHAFLAAYEMGTGKSLAFIEAAEIAVEAYRKSTGSQVPDEDLVWYVGPVAGVRAVSRELNKWDARINPRMMTYDALVKVLTQWDENQKAPLFVCFDESSKAKIPTAQRSQAALNLANSMRDDWGEQCYVLLLTGSPAPKAPTDWWHQLEIACPGFIREGSLAAFKKRLCLIEMREGSGGAFPQIITWLDDENKCAICGQFKEHMNHKFILDPSLIGEETNLHKFQKSVNEVAYLYKRMSGLVGVLYKRDCMDLPEKQYEIIQLTPTVEMLRACKLIKARSSRAITAITLMRELADGFQYDTEEKGEEECPNCKGKGELELRIPKPDIDPTIDFDPNNWYVETVMCDTCGGLGKRPIMQRVTKHVGTPKDDFFIQELDENEEIGRYVVWGGFTGTLDHLVEIAHKYCWATLRVDGRGYVAQDPQNNPLDYNEILDAMDRSHPNFNALMEKYPKVCFVGHPEAGGMALTLTASSTALFYSNSFKGEARIQAEDRIHRMGMDENRGCIIKDVMLLPTDKMVLDNLKKKRRLQDISMGELEAALEINHSGERSQ